MNFPLLALEQMRYILKPVHVWIGALILLAGLFQMLSKKGGKAHIAAGRIYVWAMIVSFITSFPISIASQNFFLASIGLFSLYLAFTGSRFAVIKSSGDLKWIDIAASVIFCLSALWMIGIAIYFISQQNALGGIVLGVFATIFSLGVFKDFYWLVIRRDPSVIFGKGKWLGPHIGRMIGSYIAAITAFLVNVQPFGSHFINWLLPTLLGSLLIRYYLKKFQPKKATKA